MTVDHEGMLWIALGGAGAVHRDDRTGQLNAVVQLPTSNPTSLAFGGADGGDPWITTSWYDLELVTTSLSPGANYRCRPGVTGPASPRYQRAPP
jgi:sugar lactone lactonase YvrE